MKGASRGTPRRLYDIVVSEAVDQRLSACERKRVYATFEQAKAHVLTLPPGSRAGTSPYRCPQCGLIHIGHRGKRRAKRQGVVR